MEPTFAFVAVVCAAVATAVVMHLDDVGRRLAVVHPSSGSRSVAWEHALGRHAQATDASDLLAAATGEIGELVGIELCWFEPFPYTSSLPRLLPGRLQVPGPEPGVTSVAWHPGGAFEVPVLVCGLPIGRLVVVPSAHAGVLTLSEPTRDAVLGVSGRLGAALGAHWEALAPAIFDEETEEE